MRKFSLDELPQLLLPPEDLLEDLAERLATTLVDEPPVTTRDGGILRAGFSAELDELKLRLSPDILPAQAASAVDALLSRRHGEQNDYEVTVPAATVLNSIDTVNGDVSISGVTAEVVAESVNGDIEVEGLVDDASLSTVNGAIDAHFTKLDGR